MFFFIVNYLSISMLLHGLYDTLLKEQLSSLSLVVALGSCVWMNYLIKDSREVDASG